MDRQDPLQAAATRSPRARRGGTEPSDANQSWNQPLLRLHTDSLVGMTVGDYKVKEEIGRGGMGIVYRAVHPLIGKQVAIKVLKPHLSQEPSHVLRLLAEARAVNAARHRNIIDIFGFGQLPDGRHYMVMELLEGEPFDTYLRARGPLPPAETCELLDDMLAALAAAHDAGVIHRDLKPSNIFVVREPDGRQLLKLLDFGLSKQSPRPNTTMAQTVGAYVTGTPGYMAPEQIRGKPVGPRADLYALGAVAYRMLTGRRPFEADEALELLKLHLQARPAPPSKFNPEVTPELDQLTLELLAKDSADRPAGAGAVRARVRRLRTELPDLPAYARPPKAPSYFVPLGGGDETREAPRSLAEGTLLSALEVSIPPRAPPEPSSIQRTQDLPPPKPPPRRRRGFALFAGVLCALLVGGGVWAGARRDGRPAPVPLTEEEAAAWVEPLEPVPAEPVVQEQAAPPPSPEPPPPEAPSPPPRDPALMARIGRLRRSLANAGDDPVASAMLESIARRARASRTPSERAKLRAELDEWQEVFLSHR